MDELFKSITEVVPEVQKTYFERISVLQRIFKDGPIGRKGQIGRASCRERV